MSKTEFDVFCPGCNMLIAAKVVAEGNGGFRSDAISPLDGIDTEYHENWGQIYFPGLAALDKHICPTLVEESCLA